MTEEKKSKMGDFSDSAIQVKTYFRDEPIILYAKFVDQKDKSIDSIKGVPDDTTIEDARVVIIRPNGERFGELVPTLKEIEGFGEWYVATLNLGFTDEPGSWLVKWIFKTNNGEISDKYNIYIASYKPSIYTWCFQSPPREDDTIPQDVRDSLNGADVDG